MAYKARLRNPRAVWHEELDEQGNWDAEGKWRRGTETGIECPSQGEIENLAIIQARQVGRRSCIIH